MGKDRLADGKELFGQMEENERDNRDLYIQDIRFARLGEQWTTEATNARGAGRVQLTLNRMNAFIRQVTNDARQNKPSIKVHPVDSGADIHTAKVIDGLIRNIEYTSRADVAYDTAIDCAASGGWGYIGVDLDYACDDSFELDIKIRTIDDPLTVYGDPDPAAQGADSANWNDAFETWMLTEEDFLAQYPDAKIANWEAEAKEKKNNGWFEKDNIRIAKWWHREKIDKKLLLLSDGMAIYEEDFTKPGPDGISMQQIAANAGIQVARERMTKSHKVELRIMNGIQELEDPQPWAGKYIPLIPVYGEVVNIEGERIYRSLIRDAKDAQRMFNYWRTQSTELVALAPKAPWVGPKGAFKTDSNKWATANTGNHQYIEYDGSVEPNRTPFAGIPAGALQEAMNAQDDMKSIMGLFDASLGAKSNETSGRAIMARQREGDVGTFHFQDNMTRAIRQVGTVVLDLIPHVYTGERIIRAMGEDGVPQSVPLNKQYAPNPQKPEELVIHNLTTGKYDVIVKAGPSFTSRREEAAFQMTEVMRAIPAAGPIIGPHLATNLDWPGADKIKEDLELVSPVRAIREQMEMKEKGIQPPPDPEVVKAEKQLELEEKKAQNDIMLSQKKMELQQQQGMLDAQIKVTEHQADMQMMGEKHSMTMQHGKEKAMQDMHSKTVSALNAPEGEDMPKHPLVQLLEAFVTSNQQMLTVMAKSAEQNNQAMQQLAVAVTASANAPKQITMQTSQGKTLTAQVNPTLQ